MEWKALGSIILLIVSIPLMIGIIKFTMDVGSNSIEENTADGTELIEQAVTPFWASIVIWLSNFGTFGSLLIVGLLIVLKKMEIL